METIKSITALQAFEKVARLQSFTKAAAELAVSKAYISKLVQGLEQQVGEKLLLRSTRKVRLTIIGEGIYKQCAGPFSEIEQIQSEKEEKMSYEDYKDDPEWDEWAQQ